MLRLSAEWYEKLLGGPPERPKLRPYDHAPAHFIKSDPFALGTMPVGAVYDLGANKPRTIRYFEATGTKREVASDVVSLARMRLSDMSLALPRFPFLALVNVL